MTYNVYFFVAIILGHFAGEAAFGRWSTVQGAHCWRMPFDALKKSLGIWWSTFPHVFNPIRLDSYINGQCVWTWGVGDPNGFFFSLDEQAPYSASQYPYSFLLIATLTCLAFDYCLRGTFSPRRWNSWPWWAYTTSAYNPSAFIHAILFLLIWLTPFCYLFAESTREKQPRYYNL